MFNKNKPYIFISYAHLDSDIVLPIIDSLCSKGFNVWYDSGIEAGSEWPEYIAEKLLGCEVFIAFLSENAVFSSNCKQEIRYAISKNKKFLRVHLAEIQLTPGMEMQLEPLQALFKYKYKNNSDFINALANAEILEDCRIEITAAESTAVTSTVSHASDAPIPANELLSRLRTKTTARTEPAPAETAPKNTEETAAATATDLLSRLRTKTTDSSHEDKAIAPPISTQETVSETASNEESSSDTSASVTDLLSKLKTITTDSTHEEAASTPSATTDTAHSDADPNKEGTSDTSAAVADLLAKLRKKTTETQGA